MKREKDLKFLAVREQFPNSKKMNVEDYARGHEIELGVVLGKE